ncbi:hypothetical protein [Limnobacter sp.]|uniref:hypothetical protein n=1 Tax=Limnobacter sp. TaxID=2003368 RepID=UPI00351957FF
MLKPYLPFYDFLLSALCVGLGLGFGVATPLAWALEWSVVTWLIVFLSASLTAYVWLYYTVFVMPSVTLSSVVIGILALTPLSVIFTFPELLAWRIGSNLFESDQARFFNAFYSLVAAIIGFSWAYLDTHIRLEKHKDSPTEPVCLMSINIYSSAHCFETSEAPRGIKTLAIVLFIVGLIMLQLFLVPSVSAETTQVKNLIAKVGVMIPSGYFWGLTFMTLGQVIYLIAHEGKASKKFVLRNFDQRLKWRHDYVKHHLPAPIRALNLRLFNQHIEAYQAYLASSKT